MKHNFRLIILLGILVSLSTTLTFNTLTFGIPNYNKAVARITPPAPPPPPGFCVSGYCSASGPGPSCSPLGSSCPLPPPPTPPPSPPPDPIKGRCKKDIITGVFKCDNTATSGTLCRNDSSCIGDDGKHTVCNDKKKCVPVAGEGSDLCNDSDPNRKCTNITHIGCAKELIPGSKPPKYKAVCKTIAGGGDNLCTTDAQCKWLPL